MLIRFKELYRRIIQVCRPPYIDWSEPKEVKVYEQLPHTLDKLGRNHLGNNPFVRTPRDNNLVEHAGQQPVDS